MTEVLPYTSHLGSRGTGYCRGGDGGPTPGVTVDTSGVDEAYLRRWTSGPVWEPSLDPPTDDDQELLCRRVWYVYAGGWTYRAPEGP